MAKWPTGPHTVNLPLNPEQAQLALDALIDYHADVLESPRDYERGTADRLSTLISKLERRLDEYHAFGPPPHY